MAFNNTAILNIKMEGTVALIKSYIISRKGGEPFAKLNDDFKKLVRGLIPYRRLVFLSLCALLRTINSLRTTWNGFDEQTLTVNDSKITHIDKLIRKQKYNYSEAKNKYSKRFVFTNDIDYDNKCRKKNKTVYNRKCLNRRIWDLSHHRNPNLFEADSVWQSKEEDEENHYSIIIESDKFNTIDVIHEPITNDQQLIGDDFLLQLVIRNLGLTIWRCKDSLALHCGLCIFGQTISECTRALRSVNSISNHVVILLGSVDIYNDATCDEMMYDMKKLSDILQFKCYLSYLAITICKIPSWANVAIHAHKNKSLALFCFNNWIKSLCDNVSNRDFSIIQSCNK